MERACDWLPCWHAVPDSLLPLCPRPCPVLASTPTPSPTRSPHPRCRHPSPRTSYASLPPSLPNEGQTLLNSAYPHAPRHCNTPIQCALGHAFALKVHTLTLASQPTTTPSLPSGPYSGALVRYVVVTHCATTLLMCNLGTRTCRTRISHAIDVQR